MSKYKPNDIITLKKEEENTKLTPGQIKMWASVSGASSKVLKIWKFKLSVSPQDAIKQGLKGKAIGDYILKKEKELFK
jgi:hypothetical protein